MKEIMVLVYMQYLKNTEKKGAIVLHCVHRSWFQQHTKAEPFEVCVQSTIYDILSLSVVCSVVDVNSQFFYFMKWILVQETEAINKIKGWNSESIP